MALFGKKKKKSASGLPPQAVLLDKALELRHPVELVMGTAAGRDSIDIRNSQVLDVHSKGYLILSQPFPRIGPTMVGKELELTFLIMVAMSAGPHWLRVGYKTNLLKIISDYKLNERTREDVLVVAQPKELVRHTLRLHFRLRPPREMGLRLFIMPERTRVVVKDVSAGGVAFTHPPQWVFKRNSEINLLLALENDHYRLLGKVVRTGRGREEKGGSQTFTAVVFQDLSTVVQRRLSRLMNDMLRQHLSSRSGVKT